MNFYPLLSRIRVPNLVNEYNISPLNVTEKLEVPLIAVQWKMYFSGYGTRLWRLFYTFRSYEGWNFNSSNYLFTTDTKEIHVSKFYCPSM